jgi:hypothetical protein
MRVLNAASEEQEGSAAETSRDLLLDCVAGIVYARPSTILAFEPFV